MFKWFTKDSTKNSPIVETSDYKHLYTESEKRNKSIVGTFDSLYEAKLLAERNLRYTKEQLKQTQENNDNYLLSLNRKDKTILQQNNRIEELELSVKNYRELLFPEEVPEGGEGSE